MHERPQTQFKHLDYTGADVYRWARRNPDRDIRDVFPDIPPVALDAMNCLLKHEDLLRAFDKFLPCDALMTGFPLGHIQKLVGLRYNPVRARAVAAAQPGLDLPRELMTSSTGSDQLPGPHHCGLGRSLLWRVQRVATTGRTHGRTHPTASPGHLEGGSRTHCAAFPKAPHLPKFQ